MQRIPEPELMCDEAQAAAYANADFSQAHDQFVSLFGETFPGLLVSDQVIDLGCGPADVTVRFARAWPECRVLGLEGAEVMLALGRTNVASASLDTRIHLDYCHLPQSIWPYGHFDVVISNSLLHHLADPNTLWRTVRQCARVGATVFVMDLLRPAGLLQARQLVDDYAHDEPEVLRRDFFNSLCAAYTAGEVEQQLDQSGLAGLGVRQVSDRHLLVSGRIIG